MKVSFLALILLCMPSISNGEKVKKRLMGVYYFKNIFGHIHQNASRYSTSLTTITCGHPIKVYEIPRPNMSSLKVVNDIWAMVKVGPYEGYLRIDHLSKKKGWCFQDRFPKFFENFDLDLAELYHWGRLNDLYVEGKSRVR